MLTVFQTPQFLLMPDLNGQRNYANVSNRLEVSDNRGKEFAVAVAVPTGLFTLMKDVMNVPRDAQATLALESLTERYVFSFLWGHNLYDLWTYSEAGVPAWIWNPEYRL